MGLGRGWGHKIIDSICAAISVSVGKSHMQGFLPLVPKHRLLLGQQLVFVNKHEQLQLWKSASNQSNYELLRF